jgi:hypothetical protein
VRSNKWIFLSVSLVLAFGLGLSGCGKKSTDAADDTSTGTGPGPGAGGGGGGGSPKAMLSFWTIANSAWTLDLSGGNLSGTTFTAVLTMSDHISGCNCPIQLNGTDSTGSCTEVTPCAWNGAGNDPTCNSGGVNFGICASGTYTNNGTNMYFQGTAYH